jgi:mono/diheme cytochrome c family protein
MLGDENTPNSDGASSKPGATSSDTGGGAAVGDGVPCDVGQVLAQSCTSCHSGATPKGGVDLTTYDALTAPSPATSSQTVIQRCAARMRDATSPMPPTGPIADADIQVIEAWIAAGTPKASCSTPTQPTPVTITCTSNKFYKGNEGGNMEPGVACKSCHTHQGGEKLIAFGGTVYPTAHEPDTCVGVNGATIVVTDANGAQFSQPANANGNFHAMASSIGSLAFPITAEIHQNGKVLKMKTAVNTGDCNSCHTPLGDNDAPGRIVAP